MWGGGVVDLTVTIAIIQTTIANTNADITQVRYKILSHLSLPLFVENKDKDYFSSVYTYYNESVLSITEAQLF